MSTTARASNPLASTLLAACLFMLLIGERVLGEGSLHNAVCALSGLLLLAALGLRARSLAAAQGDVRGVEARLLAGHLGVFGALVLYALSTHAGLSLLHLSDAGRERALGVLSVLWPAVLLVSTSAVFFMELAYVRMPIAASVELRRVRTAAYAGLTLALSVVFLLSINYVVTVRDVRRDVSYFKTTVPSRSTLAMLRKLDAPLKVVLFWRKTDDVLQQVEPYFAALRKQAPKLRYQVIDFALAPELATKHRVTGNGSVMLLMGEGDKQKVQLFRVGNELTEARAQLKKLDSLFQQNFTHLARPEHSVQLTVGHDERNAKGGEAVAGEGTRALQEIFKRLNVKSEDLGLGQGLATAVPDGSSAVVIMGPRQKFMPEETQTLLAYVQKGGRLLLMLDPDAEDGLDPLLSGLGLMRLPGTLVSEKNHMQHGHDAADKAIVYSNLYSAHPAVTTVSHYQNEVASVFFRGAALAAATGPELSPKPDVAFPLRTGPGFFRDRNGNFERDANEPEEALNMMAVVSVTQKEGASEGRVVVLGDGDFMTDKVAANNGNMLLFVDSLAWLIGNEELPSEVSSEEDVPIQHTRDKDKLWFYGTTFAVPMPVLAIGLWVASRRRRRAEVGR